MTHRIISLLTGRASSTASLKDQDSISINPSLKDSEGSTSLPQSRRSSIKHDLPVRSRASSVSSDPNRSILRKSHDHDGSSDHKTVPDPPRFTRLPDGSHVHSILPKRKKAFWHHVFKGKKDNNDLLPLQVGEQRQGLLDSRSEDKSQDMTKWFAEMQQRLIAEKRTRKLSTSSTTSNSKTNSRSQSDLVERYGKAQEVAGSGAYGIVHIHHKVVNQETKEKVLFAIKTFRPIKQKTQEKEKQYMNRFKKRITAEVSISFTLRHPNIVSTIDFVPSSKNSFCAVMEYCGGGDLFSLINSTENGLGTAEADCFFKQLMWALEYMHEMGVAHRDLKPENLLLTSKGVLKIIDFGNSECFFRSNDSSDIVLSKGCCGSPPYIAPEEHEKDRAFDPRAVDIWACGLIYMAMRLKRNLWMSAAPTDPLYSSFLSKMKQRARYRPIELLENTCRRNVIYRILSPDPKHRISASQILSSEWVYAIKVCQAGKSGH